MLDPKKNLLFNINSWKTDEDQVRTLVFANHISPMKDSDLWISTGDH
jgi:hypothetical protein